MAFDLKAFFDDYDWQMDELEPDLWHGVFSTSAEEDLDLYALLDEEWVHLGVTPFTPHAEEGIPLRLAVGLLRLNERLPLARFTLDDEGDISLRVDLPAAQLHAATLATALDVLIVVADAWCGPLARMVADATYWPPELLAAGIDL